MDTAHADRIEAWQCIGCGRIEASRPCIGVCQDRRVEFVCGASFDALARRCEQLVADNARMRELLLRLACTRPRDGHWEAAYRALQERAAVLLETLQRPVEIASDASAR